MKRLTIATLTVSVLGALFANSSYANSRSYAGLYGGTLIRASYYCSGRRTASGERFNPGGFTAAHRTLPFGTRLAVTNPVNGRTVVVRINDRGPFVRGVSLDLARGAAFAIGMRGTETVRIARVGGPIESDWQGETFAQAAGASTLQAVGSQETRGSNDATRFWGSPFEHSID